MASSRLDISELRRELEKPQTPRSRKSLIFHLGAKLSRCPSVSLRMQGDKLAVFAVQQYQKDMVSTKSKKNTPTPPLPL